MAVPKLNLTIPELPQYNNEEDNFEDFSTYRPFSIVDRGLSLPEIYSKPINIPTTFTPVDNNFTITPNRKISNFRTWFKNNNNVRGLADTMGNLAASLASSIGNFKLANMYKNMKYTSHYVPETPIKLKTTYNINPQLAAANRNTNRAIRTINENTSSSPTSLNRIRESLINNSELKSQLYGTKENKETELLNNYMKHTQEVFNRNAKALSDDISDKAKFEFNKMVNERTAKNEGINDLGKFVNSSIHDLTNNARQRDKDRNTMQTTLSTHDLPITAYYDAYNRGDIDWNTLQNLLAERKVKLNQYKGLVSSGTNPITTV